MEKVAFVIFPSPDDDRPPAKETLVVAVSASVEEGTAAVVVSGSKSPTIDDQPYFAVEALLKMQDEIRAFACDSLAKYLNRMCSGAASSNLLETTSAKQGMAKSINAILREFNLGIENPETKRPCTIVAINDIWRGKFALVDCQSHKRSHTSRTLQQLLPFKLVRIVREPE